MRDDPVDTGLITKSAYRAALDEFIGFNLSEHELITISMYYLFVCTKKKDKIQLLSRRFKY